ncbi:MAG: DUF4276 family protein [Polyangiaceae bacterium]
MEHIEILVEEPSMEAALRHLVPKIVGTVSFEIYSFQCKDDLLGKLSARLRGYSRWIPSTSRVAVLVDRDAAECESLKRHLEQIALDAGLATRSSAAGGPYTVVNRVVIEELEAWYFGDWAAVRASYPRVPAGIPSQKKYRDPDAISGGTWEAFERILQKAGYFPAGLRKIEAARTIAAHMVPERNTSRSFLALQKVLSEMRDG